MELPEKLEGLREKLNDKVASNEKLGQSLTPKSAAKVLALAVVVIFTACYFLFLKSPSAPSKETIAESNRKFQEQYRNYSAPRNTPPGSQNNPTKPAGQGVPTL